MLKVFLKKSIYLLSIILFVFLPGHVLAQQTSADTLHLTITKAEEIFLQKNLILLANQYNVDINKALVQQAKLWDNPILNTDQNIYDGKFFRHTTTNDIKYGQIYIQVQQLLRTAGKRNKLVQLSSDNVTLSQLQFNDVLRSLKYSLQSDFVETIHLLKIKTVYDNEIIEVEKLVKGMDEILKLGDISLKENIRLKALLFSLRNEEINVNTALIPIQSEIKLLLQLDETGFIKPDLTYSLPNLIIEKLPQNDSLVNLAYANRTDILLSKSQLDFQKDNLIYQKSLAKPDVTLGVEYDQNSSYIRNLYGLTASIPLNIFNKNQGNVSAAKLGIKQQEVQVDFQNNKVKNEVQTSVNKIKYYQQINNKEQLDFSNTYDKLFQNMLESYQQRRTNLLEFIDFIDAYKDTKLKLIEQHIALVKAFSEINYITNQNIIKL